MWLNERFGEDDGELTMRLLGLREQARVDVLVSAPRVLDVVL